jgi:hypothetical protein
VYSLGAEKESGRSAVELGGIVRERVCDDGRPGQGAGGRAE